MYKLTWKEGREYLHDWSGVNNSGIWDSHTINILYFKIKIRTWALRGDEVQENLSRNDKRKKDDGCLLICTADSTNHKDNCTAQCCWYGMHAAFDLNTLKIF